MIVCQPYNHVEYYRYLNSGYRLPLVGGTDKMSAGIPIGMYRTYVCVPPEQEFTHQNWCKNLAAGRSFMSTKCTVTPRSLKKRCALRVS